MPFLSGQASAGAVRAVVIDDRLEEHSVRVLDGMYAVDLGDSPASEPVVRFEDAGGALVPVPLPEGERTRVQDAPEPCPVCGAVAWVVVAASEVCCERCGFRLGRLWSANPGLASRRSAHLSPSPVARVVVRAPLSVPAYAVPGLGSSVFRVDEEDRVTVTHDVPGTLRITTSASVDSDLRTVLSDRLDIDPDFGERSEPAQMIGYETAGRMKRHATWRAAEERREITVDGVPVSFTVLAAGDVWVAHREHDGRHITIVAERFPARHVTLGALLDPDDPRAGTTADGAAVPALTRAEVEELIAECDLEAHRARILAAIRPAYRIERASGAPHRLGGLPDFAPGEQWPHDERGVPHTFIAQIDCSQLPPLSAEFAQPEWGHGGALLRIFAALGARVDDFAAVVLACPPGAPLTRAAQLPPHPEDLDWDPDEQGEPLRELDEQPVQLNPTLTAMAVWTAGLTDVDGEAYETFQMRLLLGGRPLGEDEGWDHMQLLGHAKTAQGEDPRRYADYPDGDPDDWAVLLCFNDTPGLTYLSILVPVEDLAAGRYDRLATDAWPY